MELGCVYAAPAGARIFRYWSRYTQVGAYTRKCTGCVPTQRVSFRKVSARVRGGAGAVDGTNGQDDRAHGPRSERTPNRADARRTPKPQRDAVRTLHSADEGGGTFAQPRALSQRPQTAIRESRYGACATPRLVVPAACCLDALTAQQHSRTKATVLTAITRGAPHGVLYGGRPRPRGSCRKRPGASAACSRTSSVESISSRWSR